MKNEVLQKNLVLAGMLLLVGAFPVCAQNGTWTNDGDGLWSGLSNWGGGPAADGAGSTANFNTINITTDRTVYLDSARTLSAMIFGDTDLTSPAGWTVNNNFDPLNVLTFSGTANFTVNALAANKAATVSVQIDGTSGLLKTGRGTLVLSGPNGYTGTTTVHGGGTLKLNGASGQISASSGLFLGVNNGTFAGGNAFLYDNAGATGTRSHRFALLGSQNSQPNDNTVGLERNAQQDVSLIFTAVSSNTTEQGNVINFVTRNAFPSGSNGVEYKIVLEDQTSFKISKQNAYFNGGDFAVYDISAGTGPNGYVRGINYGLDAASATSAGGSSFAATTSQQITGSITAQPAVTLAGGTLNGSLKIVGSSNLTMQSGASLTLTGGGNQGSCGILKTGGGTSTISGGSVVNFNNTQWSVRVDGPTDVLNIAMPVSVAGNQRLMKSGEGRLILSGGNINLVDGRNNLYINAGTLEIGGSSTFTEIFAGNQRFAIAGGAVFKYNSTSATSTIGMGIAGEGGVVVNAGTLTLTGSGSYTGGTTITGGTLALNNTSGSATGTGPVTVASGGRLGGNGLSTSAVTVQGGGKLLVEISDWTGAPGVGFKDLSVGSLNLAGATWIVDVTSATNFLNFSENVAVFPFITAPGGITGFSGANVIVNPDLAFTGSGNWGVQLNGNSLELVYLPSSGVGFAAWMSTNYPTIPNADNDPDDDPDKDGLKNAIEYVLGKVPNVPDAGGLVPSVVGANFVVKFERWIPSKTADVSLVIDTGTAIAVADDWTDTYLVGDDTAGSAGEITVTPHVPATDYETITLTVPRGADLRKFARMRVAISP